MFRKKIYIINIIDRQLKNFKEKIFIIKNFKGKKYLITGFIYFKI